MRACALVLLVGILAGCGGGTRAAVTVTPRLSREDEPVHLTVTGLRPRSTATVTVTSTDARGRKWRSSARFRADARGTVDADRTPSLAGTYTGVWGTGFITSLRPASGVGAYFWSGATPRRFDATVRSGGRRVATTSFRRRLSARPLHVTAATVARDGFVGTYFARAGDTSRPAVLAFGGSEGGNSAVLIAALLAAHGYPTLSVAYFGAPGLPQTLLRIPLEYFRRTLAWLGRRPEVDARHVLTLGISRGSEAALLLGVHYPRLVHGVVASVPSDVAICSYPGCAGPAWTLGGRALPYTRELDDPHPTDDPAAVIPVERIRGPIFLDCAEEDQVWTSCPYARAIVERLATHHVRYRRHLFVAPQADHGLGSLVPDEPSPAPQVDQRARERLWPQLLAFLARVR